MIITGGGRWKVPVETTIGATDDSEKSPILTQHLKDSMKDYLTGWGEEALGEGLLCDWTGIMGYTPEGTLISFPAYLISDCVLAVPYVGPVHGRPGAFISAGHSGHGKSHLRCRTDHVNNPSMYQEWLVPLPVLVALQLS